MKRREFIESVLALMASRAMIWKPQEWAPFSGSIPMPAKVGRGSPMVLDSPGIYVNARGESSGDPSYSERRIVTKVRDHDGRLHEITGDKT